MTNFKLDSIQKVNEKLGLVQNLAGIMNAQDAINEKKAKAKAEELKTGKKPSKIDENYQSLNCDVEYLKPGTPEYQMIDDYVNNTGSGYKKLQYAFKINRHNPEPFDPKQVGNKWLLWHGSRFSNMVGILSQGLRIAPPEVPHNGYVHGKGIYMASSLALSEGYSDQHGLVFLCEAALGKQMDEIQYRQNYYMKPLPDHLHSTHVQN